MNRTGILLLLNLLSAISGSGVSAQQSRQTNFPKVTEYPGTIPPKKNVWVFIMAGQSNMAGRAFVEAIDTISNPRILTINKAGELILAKEPLHFYEPGMSGLDCGISFAHTLLKKSPDSISILLIPAAVGGSSIDQWLGDSLHRNVKLLTNLKNKIAIAQRYGVIKALLWHQGESDAKMNKVTVYKEKLELLFQKFSNYCNNKELRIITGGIGLFADDKFYQQKINAALELQCMFDTKCGFINTVDFTDIGDKLHFDSRSQRLMGERMANNYCDTPDIFKKTPINK